MIDWLGQPSFPNSALFRFLWVSCLNFWCVHTKHKVKFMRSTSAYKVNAKKQTDAWVSNLTKGDISVWTHHYNACISKVGSTALNRIFKCFSFISCIFSTDISNLYFILIWTSLEGTRKHYRQSYWGGFIIVSYHTWHTWIRHKHIIYGSFIALYSGVKMRQNDLERCSRCRCQ